MCACVSVYVGRDCSLADSHFNEDRAKREHSSQEDYRPWLHEPERRGGQERGEVTTNHIVVTAGPAFD